ncbi:MAG: hypothetical protein HY782_25250 [Chloroflexi bacterium]|nr:hypothetical protein [Chloroflexota bacterium]
MIGTKNERSLHKAIKAWYALPGDELEVKVDGCIIDIVRADLLIEIQTKNFAAISRKLRRLVQSHKLRLLYPIVQEKWITRTNASGARILGKRKSPRRGDLFDLFDELVYIPDLIGDVNFELQVLLTREEEIRGDDGKGSWRRRGFSVRDRKLIEVVETVTFKNKHDFLRFLPADLPHPFTNKILAKLLGAPVHDIRRMTYCFRKMGLIRQVGKSGHEMLFAII